MINILHVHNSPSHKKETLSHTHLTAAIKQIPYKTNRRIMFRIKATCASRTGMQASALRSKQK